MSNKAAKSGHEVTGRPFPTQSVYQRVLGDDFAALNPRLQRYFSFIPLGSVGRGRCRYDTVGSRHRWLRPVFAFLAWRHILFPERGTNIPFTVENRSGSDGSLSARRLFSFPHVTRVMDDTMQVADGMLVDRLGRRRGLEVHLALSVHNGELRMRSRRLALTIKRLRIPLPPLVTLTLTERPHADREGWQSVDVRLRAPVLGEVFRYAGSFEYTVVPDTVEHDTAEPDTAA